MPKQIYPPLPSASENKIPRWVYYAAAGLVIGALVIVIIRKSNTSKNEQEN